MSTRKLRQGMKALIATFALSVTLSAAAQAETLHGSGSTFIAPLMLQWVGTYEKENPQVDIHYSPVGSGQGISDYKNGGVDFGATDAPLSSEELAKLPQPTLQLPVTAGAVVFAYNLPGVGMGLRLSGEVLSDIFLGKITHWDDPRIRVENPGISFPSQPIIPVHRSDGSGTTFLFAKYLASVSAEWRTAVGAAKTVAWPTGRGGNGNQGVATLVKKLSGAIGYVELAFTEPYKLTYGSLKNRAGNYVMPSVGSITAAIKAAVKAVEKNEKCKDLPLIDGEGVNSYPITGLTYLLIPKALTDPGNSQTLLMFLQWILGPGQKMAEAHLYAPLPQSLLKANLKALGREPVASK